MNNFVNELQTREFIYQSTNLVDLKKSIESNKIKAYIGFDCTAKSLHVGSLIQIMMLRWLQKFGHQPIILLGGGTTKIGDPSGKDETRQVLNFNDIEENKNSIKEVFAKFLNFDSDNKAIVLDNDEWLKDINYIDFLRDFGKYFSINRMINFESVKLRLDREQSLSFLEFNYMLLQAFDFYHLYNKEKCVLQMGGSDQWGNIVNGVELIRKKLGKEVFGLTSPLLTTSSGAKMGKTANGAVWLNEELLSPYEYWQFWRNTEDADVVKFLKLFTELPLEYIDELSKLSGKKINDAKIILADEATKLCHGIKAANAAKTTSKQTFEANNVDDNLPKYEISSIEIESRMSLFKLLVSSGLAESNSAARKLIQGNGVRVNNNVVNDINYIIKIKDFNNSNLKLSVGKKKHMLIKLTT
ncbi:tyrosine--tRNA ligase [Rickettsiales endosymbiont of Trichoplax sp. H2]|uniref:tyrosine--tRNA ligase n=1 Tax=Rickettsiales endosymbiont of Trichoplax sp. H2 TaxID=2021221 RepID=UPI0012B21EF6|nr:tyrosine--tRNA ligase [Rickettsiales endosymbiont of Trichoplax sp. H2]MSO13993.1 Tyrosine--tRNA ligase [Rickettsiales endosymbiont of Trichoplax sp. H2]